MKINVIEYFAQTVERYGDKLAVLQNNEKITFAQLEAKAKKIASAIGTSSDQRVIALLMDKSINTVATLLGVLYSGNIYMPLDPKMPSLKLQKILDNIEPSLIICDDKAKFALKNMELINFDELLNFYENKEFGFAHIIDTDLAYIINTSGTTSTPKGVAISHRSLIDYVLWLGSVEAIAPNSSDVIASQAPLFFDNSVLDLYSCFFTGATLALIDERYFAFPLELAEKLRDSGTTFIFFVPTILSSMARARVLDLVALPLLRVVAFAGEHMRIDAFRYWQSRCGATFANLYGPTEITVDCAYYVIDREFGDNEVLPIGKACKNTALLLFDENMQKIETKNVDGVLYVRGSSLSMGYYNDFAKSKNAFITNPLNKHYDEKIYNTGDIAYINDFGEFVIKGRVDTQIKHSGYRIELSEIEFAMKDLADDAFALYVDGAICLAYVNSKKLENREIFLHLKDRINKYMIPTKFIYLASVPLLSNGKTDKMAIKAMFEV